MHKKSIDNKYQLRNINHGGGNSWFFVTKNGLFVINTFLGDKMGAVESIITLKNSMRFYSYGGVLGLGLMPEIFFQFFLSGVRASGSGLVQGP